MLEVKEKEFNLSKLIVLEVEAIRPYKILEMREIYIIKEEEELYVENKEEELECKQDSTKEVLTIKLWELTNALDDSIWYKEENPVI